MQIRNIFKFEKGSLKRKIAVMLAIMLVLILAVVFGGKLLFPEPDSDAVSIINYELTEAEEYSKFNLDMTTATNWFVAKIPADKTAEKNLITKAQTVFNGQKDSLDNLANAIVFVKRDNGLRKVVNSIKKASECSVKARTDLQSFYDVQLKKYISQPSLHNDNNTLEYFSTYNKLLHTYLMEHQKYVSAMMKVSADFTDNVSFDSPLAKAYRKIAGVWGEKVLNNMNEHVQDAKELNVDEQNKYLAFFNSYILASETAYYDNPSSFENLIKAVNSQNLSMIVKSIFTDKWDDFYGKQKEENQTQINLIKSVMEGV